MTDDYELDVKWRAFPLHPETPEHGIPLEKLFAGTVDIPQMLRHLQEVADSLGLPFGERHNTYNSRMAQELGLWAESQGRGHAFHMAAFHAYFAAGKNLADRHVLLDLAGKAGLDRTAAEQVVEKRSFRAAVDADWHLAREKGVTAVPTFIINGKSLTGARPYKDLERFVQTAAGPLPRKK